jgi:hypothetical protein
MPIKLTISQQPNGVLFSGSGTLNTTSLQNLGSWGFNVGPGYFFRGQNRFIGAAIGQIKLYSNVLQNLAPISTLPSFLYTNNNVINLTTGPMNYVFSIGNPWNDAAAYTNAITYSQSYVSNQPFNFSYLIPNQTYTTLGIIPQNNTYTWTNQQLGISDSLQVEVLSPITANIVITVQEVLGTVNVSAVGTLNPNGLVPVGVFSLNPGGYMQY